MAGGVELARQLLPALGDPRQWAHRIAHRRRLDKARQVAEQRTVGRGDRRAPAAGAAHTARLQRRPGEVLQTTNNPCPRQPGDRSHTSDPAPSRGPRLARCEHAPAALVPLRAVRLPPQSNRVAVDHPPQVTQYDPAVNPPESIRRTFFHTQLDSVISAARLRTIWIVRTGESVPRFLSCW